MSYVDFVSLAIQRAQEGATYDQGNEYEKALASYTQAVQTFLLAIKHERDPNRKMMLQIKTKELLDRAERIKDYLETQNAKKDASDGGGGGGAGGGGGGAGGAGQGTVKKRKAVDEDRQKLRDGLQESIVSEKPNVQWSDIAGLEEAKRALRQAVVLPMMVPHIFTGKREPWKGLLLYGPPGTGKTFLAKAAASQCDCTFFSISSSNLMSKWLGESERLVRNLFEMARECAPAIVFVDEVDSLCSARDDSGGSDATHRVLTEFLAQMDGVGQDKGERVLVLGATNLPWALDPAIRRRFERRIYIPLPDATARRSMFDIHMGDHPHTLTEADWQELVPRTELYSGADIRNLCRAALMQGVASIEAATHFREVRSQDPANRQGALLEPCAPSHPGASPMDFADMSPSDLRRLVPPPVTKEDFLGHVQGMGSVTADQIQKFEEFTNKFGSGKPRA